MLRSEALQLVFPLADGVQFSLYLCQEAKSKRYFIKGHGSVVIPLNSELEYVAKCKVVASGINDKESYIIMSVDGDLHFLLSYDKVMRELTFCLLKGKTTQFDVLSFLSLKTLYDSCMPRVRGMWMREERNEQWSRLDAVAGVDEATVVAAEQTSRPDHCVS